MGDLLGSASLWLRARFAAPKDGCVSLGAVLGAATLHLVVFLGAVTLIAITKLPPSQTATEVTVVSALPSGGPEPKAAAADLERMLADVAADANSQPSRPATPPMQPGQARLDELFQPSGETISRSRLDDLLGGKPSSASASGGSATPMAGLARGETLGPAELFNTASLPPVGRRSASPLEGDIWRGVQPCWLAISPSAATIVIEVDRSGKLVGTPLVLRHSRPSAEQFLAEMSAIRALEACAPYPGVSARKWRVTFPGRPGARG